MLSPSAPSRTSTSPRNSPHAAQGKRKRKTLSCYECRRRKLKCDREEPACSRCRKGGHPEICSYVYDLSTLGLNRHLAPGSSALPSSTVSQQPGGSSHGVTLRHHTTLSPPPRVSSQFIDISGKADAPHYLEASQNQGTWQLLGQVSLASSGIHPRPAIKADAEDLISSPREVMPKETVIFRGENFRTQYYGGSNATSSIAHFPELRTFMKETIQSHTALPRVQRDVKSMQLRWKASRTDDVKAPTHEELLKLLPDRETADRHVHLYFQTVETTYRILHYQSFYKEYEALWEQPQQVNSGIVVILLLVMASVSCLIAHKQPKYIGDSSMSREQAIFWIEVAEKWLARQSQKHLHLAIWQIRCLIILAKLINVVKKKRIWTEAGTLVREGMSAGFHRDPRLLGEKVSFFDQEMRRRLWATIIELELQVSIDRGMPSASAGIPSDTATVLNINDKDLEESGRPRSRPITEYTSTSFLHLSTSSFSLRVSLNSLINDLSSPLLYENVLKYEDMIMKELEKLGAASGVQEAQWNRNSLIANALLDIQLRQFLIMLHAPFARQAETNSRFALSRMICLDAAAEILKQYTELNRNGDFSLLLLRTDYFRAALVICQTTFVNLTINTNLIINSNSTTFIQYLEDALVLLEQRITQHGTGYTYYWYISAASAFLRCMLVPAESSREKEEAINRVTRQYYRVLAWQEDILKAKDIIVPMCIRNVDFNQTSVLPNDMSDPTGLPPLPTGDAQDIQMDMPLDEFFFGNPAAWTFENLWSID